eukprot:152632-Chlamydomonas_euryale.AAC.1
MAWLLAPAVCKPAVWEPARAWQGTADAHPLRLPGAQLPHHLVHARDAAAARCRGGVRDEGKARAAAAPALPALLCGVDAATVSARSLPFHAQTHTCRHAALPAQHPVQRPANVLFS